jgi:cellulose biosynthesis protein BcsQ
MKLNARSSAEYTKRRVKELRDARSFTQENLAERAGLSVETIQRVERVGKGSRSTINAIAKGLGTASESLVGSSKTFVTAIMSEKGGVGRTTICFNLAALLAGRGHKVCAIQVDEWGQLFKSCHARPADLPCIPSCILSDPDMLDDWMSKATTFSHIFIDGTRYSPEINRSLVSNADLVLIPVTNRVMDVPGIDLLMQQIAAFVPSRAVPVMLVFNQVWHQCYREVKKDLYELELRYQRPFAHAVLTARATYARSHYGGITRLPPHAPSDTPRAKDSKEAAKELAILWREAEEFVYNHDLRPPHGNYCE